MIELTGHDLSLEAIEDAAVRRMPVSLAETARSQVRQARDFVEELLESGERIYGVTTGFGRLAEVVISPDQQEQLQRNLVRSHASGLGPPMAAEEVRTIMVLRANALARGNSGCREQA